MRMGLLWRWMAERCGRGVSCDVSSLMRWRRFLYIWLSIYITVVMDLVVSLLSMSRAS